MKLNESSGKYSYDISSPFSFLKSTTVAISYFGQYSRQGLNLVLETGHLEIQIRIDFLEVSESDMIGFAGSICS